jgi:hypothetical protein
MTSLKEKLTNVGVSISGGHGKLSIDKVSLRKIYLGYPSMIDTEY